jgi:hypothetical protein
VKRKGRRTGVLCFFYTRSGRWSNFQGVNLFAVVVFLVAAVVVVLAILALSRR